MSTIEVRVASKTEQAQDIYSFELVHPTGQPLPAFTAGAHIDVFLPNGLTRQYSLCNDPRETHRYQIAVLRDPVSRGGSMAMHDLVKSGDLIAISAPKNHFPLHESAGKSLLFAGGIGVTPIWSMAQRLQTLGSDFEFHYSARSGAKAAFVEVMKASAFASKLALHFDDGDAAQRLDLPALLAHELPQAAHTHLYVCGPQGFMDWVLSTARQAGWPEECLHFEFFSASVDKRSDDGSFEVVIASSGQVITVAPEVTVVQALKQAGVTVAVSCEQGVCGTCLCGVLEGTPDHRDMYLTADEQASNKSFLPCCSRATSTRLVLDL